MSAHQSNTGERNSPAGFKNKKNCLSYSTLVWKGYTIQAAGFQNLLFKVLVMTVDALGHF